MSTNDHATSSNSVPDSSVSAAVDSHGVALAGPRQQAPGNPRTGYYFAVLYAIISGVAIYVNSRGVKTFSDSTLYTALKNAIVGVCVLIPFIVLAGSRREFKQLGSKQVGLLIVVALIGGSVAYALNFYGLKVSTPVTAALVDHTQFLYVAIIAAVVLHERFGLAVWLGLIVLFIGLSFGIKVNAVRWDTGVIFLLAATLMFAFDFVLIKYLLGSVSMLMVMLFKMSVGAALLLVYVGATGHLGEIRALTAAQWGYVIVTGLILLAFTLTSIAGLRHASATAVIAIGAGSPIITTLLVVIDQHTPLSTTTVFGLALMLIALLIIFTFGRRREVRAAQSLEYPIQRKVVTV